MSVDPSAPGIVAEPPRPILTGPPGTGLRDYPAAAAFDVFKRYGQGEAAVAALQGVTATFPVASFTAIMGPSGSGKSTLMHVLAGLDRPTSGEVQIAGRPLGSLGDRQLTLLRRAEVGFVFQAFNLLPVLSAQENVLLPLTLAGQKADHEWLEMLLRTMELAERRDHLPAALSGGQQQRVAIARALITRPAVVFADEPTGNLDSTASDQVLDLLRRAADEFGQTIVLVTHDPLAAARADRVLFLDDGRIHHEAHHPSADQILHALKER